MAGHRVAQKWCMARGGYRGDDAPAKIPEERKVGQAEALGSKGRVQVRGELWLPVHHLPAQPEVERGHLGDDGEVEALRICGDERGVRSDSLCDRRVATSTGPDARTRIALVEPSVAERHEEGPEGVAEGQSDAAPVRR